MLKTADDSAYGGTSRPPKVVPERLRLFFLLFLGTEHKEKSAKYRSEDYQERPSSAGKDRMPW